MTTEYKLPISTDVLEVRINTYDLSSYEYQKRRHEDWRDNYELNRDKVITNRLTQRQTVNVPLMKETLKTIESKTDEVADTLFENLSNNRERETFLNEYWALSMKRDNLVLKDAVHKKQVNLYGRSFRKLMVYGGHFHSEILDPHDVLIDRNADPTDIDGTARYVKHQNIYRSIGELKLNEFYDQGMVKKLEEQFATSAGLIKSQENAEAAQHKADRLRDMGVPDVENPAVGEAIVELSEHYVKIYNADYGCEEWWVVTKAEGKTLSCFPLEYIIGELEDHFWRYNLPFTSWADDIERTDMWSDGAADVVRQANKVLNAWFSQLVENRTLRNFGMNYYDSTASDNFVPQTYEPAPWGWYPVPGDPNKIVKKVDVPDLSESLDEMMFVIRMVERATATSATEKGQTSSGQVTLGEIKLVAEKALERITSIAKYYRLEAEQFAFKWLKMVWASGDYLDAVKLYKKGHNGKFYEREIDSSDWIDELGYKVVVTSSSEQEDKSLKTIQKFNAVMAQMADNIPLRRIYQKKLLGLIKLTTEEEREILDFEKNKLSAAQSATPNPADNPMLARANAMSQLPAPINNQLTPIA